MADAAPSHAPPQAPPSPVNESDTSEFCIHIRGLIGPPMSESQRVELNEWTEDIFSKALSSDLPVAKPSATLLQLLGDPTHEQDGHWKNIICPVIQMCLREAVESNTDNNAGENNSHASISMNAPLEFTFKSNSYPQLPVALHLYYFALQSILRGHSDDSRSSLLLNTQFHKSLFGLCHFCISKATNQNQSLFDIQGTGSCPIVYYKLIEAFVTEMNSDSDQGLPSHIIQVLRQIQEMLLDSLWSFDYDGEHFSDSFGPTFIGMINKLRESPSSWPLASLRTLCPIKSGVTLSQNEVSKESVFVGYIIQKLLLLIEGRLQTLCRELSLSKRNEMSLSKANDVKEKTMTLFISLMCYRIDMFFYRHPDQIMLCSLYIVCNKMEMASKIAFKDIIRVYDSEKMMFLSGSVVKSILYRIENCTEDGDVRNIVSFYNVSIISCVIKHMS